MRCSVEAPMLSGVRVNNGVSVSDTFSVSIRIGMKSVIRFGINVSGSLVVAVKLLRPELGSALAIG